jgi:thioredoxin 1
MKELIIFTILTTLLTTPPTESSRPGCDEQKDESPASARVQELDQTSFDAEIKSGVVLVDFWATWCLPCRMQGPIVNRVAAQVEGKAKVAKVNIDKASSVAKRFDIQSIPTLVVFKDGKPQKQFVGLTRAKILISAITSAADSN